jgi:hypothetical protein
MSIYISRERPLNHATEVRRRAMAKAERYEELGRAFRDWAGSATNVETGLRFTEEDMTKGERTLAELVEFWRRKAEAGEQDGDVPV